MWSWLYGYYYKIEWDEDKTRNTAGCSAVDVPAPPNCIR